MMKMDTDKLVMLKLRGFKVTEPRPLPVTPMVTLHSCPNATVEILDAEAEIPPKVEPKSMVLLFGGQLIQALGKGVAVGRNCEAHGRTNKRFKMG